MIIPLILLVISAIVIAALIGNKLKESPEKISGWRTFCEKGDAFLRENLAKAKVHAPIFEEGTVVSFFRVFLLSVLESFLYMRNKIRDAWSSFSETMDSRRILKQSGQVSFFLKNVAEYKSTSRRG